MITLPPLPITSLILSGLILKVIILGACLLNSLFGSEITSNSIYIKGIYDTTGSVLISGTGISITLEIQEVTETVV